MGPAGEIVNKAEYPNHVWSYDFLEDRTERGGKLRILVIIDEFTRECLNENWFLSLDDAREKVEIWRKHYNRERPHGALGNLTPMEFAMAGEAVN